MKLGTFAMAAGLAVGLAAFNVPGSAQSPLWDVVHVNIPYSVTLGDKTLAPGEYTIEQNRDSSGGSRILLIYSDKGMRFETSAMTIPALDPGTARDTKVVLHHFGSDYYLDKIWVQGKDYGYEFPLPSGVKDREKERQASVTVPAQYSTTPAASDTTATAATTSEQQTAAAASTPPPTPVAPPEPATPAETTPSTATNDTAQTSMPPATPNSADRVVDDAPAPTPVTMPSTSAGWLMMLLGGGSLSGLGMAIRRRR